MSLTSNGLNQYPLATALRAHAKTLGVLLAAILAQLALIAAFSSAMSDPTLHDATVGLVAGTATGARTSAASQPEGVVFKLLPDRGTALTQVRDGDLPAALVVGQDGSTLIVAGSAGPALVAAITATIRPYVGGHLVVDDVRPLPGHDPPALGTFLLVIGWVIGGYLGMMLLSRTVVGAFSSLSGALRLLTWTVLYAIVSAALAVILIDPIMHVVTGHPGELLAAGMLIVFAVSSFTAACLSLLKMPGLILAISSLVILGNPTSGGSVPDQMLSGGWHFLAEILPTNSAVSLVRSLAYFGGHHAGLPSLVLTLYGTVSVVLIGVLGWRRGDLTAKSLRAPQRHPMRALGHTA